MYKQAPKSSAMKALVGNQKNLPQALKAQIEAAPGKMMSPAKQTSAPELKTTTKNTGGLSAMALANAGRDMLKSDYGIDYPYMSNKAIADSIKKVKRTDEVRSRVKQGLKKGDNEGEFEGSFGSPAQMKSPAKSVKIVTKDKKDQIAVTNDQLRRKHTRSSFKAAEELKRGKVNDIKDGVELRKRGYNTSLGRPKINIK
jgi:ribosomal protein L21E